MKKKKVKFYPYKEKGVGVGGKGFSHAEGGGGVKTLFEVVLTQVSAIAKGGGCFCLLQRLMALV